MANVIRTALSDRQVANERAAVVFLNKEAIPLLREMRNVLNTGGAITGDTSSDVGNYVPVWTSDTAPTAGTWSIHVRAVLSDSNDDGAVFFLAASYRMIAGAPTLIGSTAIFAPHESTGAFDWQWSADATTVTLALRDAGVAASYALVVDLIEATP